MTKSGQVSDVTFSLVDIFATLAHYLGFELPDNSAQDSHDFLPWLIGEAQEPPRTTIVHNTFENQNSIRHGDWVLINDNTGANRQPSSAWRKRHSVPANGRST